MWAIEWSRDWWRQHNNTYNLIQNVKSMAYSIPKSTFSGTRNAVKLVTPVRLKRNISKTTRKTSNLVHGFVWRMTSKRTKISPKSGRGLGHVTPTIFGSTVGYPSDSLASCYFLRGIQFCHKGSQCSGHLYRIKPWIETFWSTPVVHSVDWLDLNTFAPAEDALP